MKALLLLGLGVVFGAVAAFVFVASLLLEGWTKR